MPLLSYEKEFPSVSRIKISADTEIVIYYTHFMSGAYSKWNDGEHSHSFYELHIVLEGDFLSESEGETIKLSKNEYILFPPKATHRVCDRSEAFLRYSVAFDVVYGDDKAYSPSGSPLKGTLDSRLGSYTEKILSEETEKDIGCENVINAMLCGLLIEILRDLKIFGASERKPQLNRNVNRAVRFINENITRGIRTRDVAEAVFISTRQLNRLFCGSFGITAAQYIKVKKLEHIKEYLRETELSIKEIAFVTGFESESALCGFFKRETGASPKKFRSNA